MAVSYSSMRRLLLIAMIIMLPLRGVVGDAMAMQMTNQSFSQAAASETVTTNFVAARAYSVKAIGDSGSAKTEKNVSSMPCHDMVDQAVNSAEDTASQSSNTVCTSCQVCHLTAACLDSVSTSKVRAAHPPLAFAPPYWASAELPQATKPPAL